jgi:N-acetyl sugar amidotransferase
MSKDNYKRCIKGVWDTTIPNIKFDEEGVSNYYKMFTKLETEFPTGDEGKKRWEKIIAKIKEEGKGKKYDCLIGLSGGVDSCYLLHLAVKEWGLRPLAFNLDNGWSSDIAVSNIKTMSDHLNVDLETYVVDYEEVKSVLRAFMKAGLPWVDGATDHAIKSSIYKIAAKEGIKNILVGTDFRSEGKQPEEWTHGDAKLFKHVVKTFEGTKLKTYPNMSLRRQIYYGAVKKIKRYQPFYFLNYQKKKAKDFLIKNYDWKDYGGHHHENLFTKFIISYWLKKKFNIDKRIITFSAQVITKQKDREEAMKELSLSPYDLEQMERDKKTVIKKLDLTEEEFEKIWNQDNKTFRDYPSHYDLFMKNKNLIKKYSHYVMPTKPKMIVVEE